MGLILISPPTSEPVSLSDVKAHLRITHDHEDGLITTYLKAARAYVEKHTNKSAAETTWMLTLDSFGSAWCNIRLPKPPLLQVELIQYIDTDGVIQTLSDDDYIVVASTEPAYIRAVSSWPSTKQIPEAVNITFTCGYSADSGGNLAPENIKLAILLLVSQYYDNRGIDEIGAALEQAVHSLLPRFYEF